MSKLNIPAYSNILFSERLVLNTAFLPLLRTIRAWTADRFLTRDAMAFYD
jgi:hypothetical protein